MSLMQLVNEITFFNCVVVWFMFSVASPVQTSTCGRAHVITSMRTTVIKPGASLSPPRLARLHRVSELLLPSIRPTYSNSMLVTYSGVASTTSSVRHRRPNIDQTTMLLRTYCRVEAKLSKVIKMTKQEMFQVLATKQ